MKNKKKNVGRIAIILAFILLPIGAFGFGYFLKDKSENKELAYTLTVDGNIISQDIDVNSNGIVPGDSISVPISIKPNSTEESLLRVKVEPYWINNDNSESNLSNKNLKLIDVNVDKNMSNNSWYKENEYYYFMGKVKNEESINLIDGIEFVILNETDNYNVNEYQGKKIGMKVSLEMIQCSGGAYKIKWNNDNKLSQELINKLDTIIR